jgi:hyperosmotically inducible protein
MKLNKVLAIIIIPAGLFLTGCAPKDADIKARVDDVIKADSLFTGANAEVKDGIVTITGEMKDSTCKDMCVKTIREKDIKGVKEVVNNATVKPQVISPILNAVTTVLDEDTQQKVKDGLKDIKGVTVSFDTEKVILVGQVSEADRIKIMGVLAWAKVKSDVDKLITKK